MEKAKYKNLEKCDQVEKLPQPPLELAASGNSIHELPDPLGVKVNKINLTDAINNRMSVRAYSDESLSLDEIIVRGEAVTEGDWWDAVWDDVPCLWG
jgi:hypothetical protein